MSEDNRVMYLSLAAIAIFVITCIIMRVLDYI